MTDNSLPMQKENQLFEALAFFLMPQAQAVVKSVYRDTKQAWIEHTAKQVTDGMKKKCENDQQKRCQECTELLS